jgi:type VI secretion system secreted protein VgrG
VAPETLEFCAGFRGGVIESLAGAIWIRTAAAMATYTQANRVLSVTSSLGTDVLLLLGFTGTESISRLFSFQLKLASEQGAIAAKDIVGKSLTWSINRPNEAPRYFNGVVRRFVGGPVSRRKLRSYRADVVPWLWLLSRTTDCRIFQNLNTPDIVQTIFKDHGFNDFKLALKSSYPKREYCVQYRETALNFIARLLEHEGIFYYFRHEDGKHTLVLADSKSAYADCPENPLNYMTALSGANRALSWERQYEFRAGKCARTDYNFQTPSTNLLTTTSTVIDLPDAPKYEIFDYPGEYVVKDVGDPVTKVRMEEEEAGYDVVNGSSRCSTFTPCGKFTLAGHEVDSENGSYAITSIQHSAVEGSEGAGTSDIGYSNNFTCIPDSVLFRPARMTSKPMVQGPQTAVVTGPPGEAIYPDKYGRVKVQFFWDRRGKKDENSSCWIRVATAWAGKGWGQINIPRVGHEVIVDFLEGDPDRPIIIGSVYNAENMPAKKLPEGKKTCGLVTRTNDPSVPGFNQITCDDSDGKEMITIHGQYDMSTTIEHDENWTVHNNRTTNVDVDDAETVGGNQTNKVQGNRTEAVDTDESITIHGKRTEVVDGTESITIHSKRTENITAGGEEVNITGATNHKVTGNYTRKVEGTYELGATANIHTEANANWEGVGKAQASLQAPKVYVKGDGSVQIESGGSSIVLTPGSIVLSSGGGQITLDGGGVTIVGTLVKIN